MLTVTNVDKYYGGVKAVEDVSLEVDEGKIIGLIGTNGAGKTTLFNVISGFDKLDRGSVNFEGKEISNLLPSKIANLGMIRTFQTATGFPRLTVLENLLVFAENNNFEFYKNFLNKNKQNKELIDKAENHARKILKKKMKHLHSLAKSLLEYETLSGEDVNQLIKKGKLKNKDSSSDDKSDGIKTSLPVDGAEKKNKKVGGLNPKPAIP